MPRQPMHPIDFLNGQKRWGKLTFRCEVPPIPKTSSGGNKCKVRVGEFLCDCGRIYLARLALVKRGTTKSCITCADRARWAAKRHG